MDTGTFSKAFHPNNSGLTVPHQPLPLITEGVDAAPADQQGIAACRTWLSEHRVWGQLPTEALQAIAQSFHSFQVESQTLIYQEGHASPSGCFPGSNSPGIRNI